MARVVAAVLNAVAIVVVSITIQGCSPQDPCADENGRMCMQRGEALAESLWRRHQHDAFAEAQREEEQERVKSDAKTQAEMQEAEQSVKEVAETCSENAQRTTKMLFRRLQAADELKAKAVNDAYQSGYNVGYQGGYDNARLMYNDFGYGTMMFAMLMVALVIFLVICALLDASCRGDTFRCCVWCCCLRWGLAGVAELPYVRFEEDARARPRALARA